MPENLMGQYSQKWIVHFTFRNSAHFNLTAKKSFLHVKKKDVSVILFASKFHLYKHRD